MPETIRQPNLETEYHSYVIKYKCPCGNEITFYNTEKPKILFKCFDCLPKIIIEEDQKCKN